MILYTKYECSAPCSNILKTYFWTLWPTYATKWNSLNNFDRGPPRYHSCDVWSKSNEWFQRRRCFSKKVYARRTTHDARRTADDGQRPVTIAHHEHFVLRWAKNTQNNTKTRRTPRRNRHLEKTTYLCVFRIFLFFLVFIFIISKKSLND